MRPTGRRSRTVASGLPAARSLGAHAGSKRSGDRTGRGASAGPADARGCAPCAAGVSIQTASADTGAAFAGDRKDDSAPAPTGPAEPSIHSIRSCSMSGLSRKVRLNSRQAVTARTRRAGHGPSGFPPRRARRGRTLLRKGPHRSGPSGRSGRRGTAAAPRPGRRPTKPGRGRIMACPQRITSSRSTRREGPGAAAAQVGQRHVGASCQPGRSSRVRAPAGRRRTADSSR